MLEATLPPHTELSVKYVEMLAVGDNQFDLWSRVAVEVLIVSVLDEPANRELAIRVLRRFYCWYLLRRGNKYMPRVGVMPMYSKDTIGSLIGCLENEAEPAAHIYELLYAERYVPPNSGKKLKKMIMVGGLALLLVCMCLLVW